MRTRRNSPQLDLEIGIRHPLSPVVHDYPSAKLTLHPFLCHHTSGEPKLIECQQALWINPPRLREFRFPPANESLIEEVIRITAPDAAVAP